MTSARHPERQPSPISAAVGPEPPEAVREILAATSKVCGVRIRDIQGKDRNRRIVRARQVAVHLTHERVRDLSWPMIGEIFGIDHSTAMHASRRIVELMQAHPALASAVERIKALLDADEPVWPADRQFPRPGRPRAERSRWKLELLQDHELRAYRELVCIVGLSSWQAVKAVVALRRIQAMQPGTPK